MINWNLDMVIDVDNELKSYYKKIHNSDITEKVKIIEDVYKYIKLVTPDFFIEGKISPYYKKIKESVIRCEQLIEGYFIIPNEPIYKELKKPIITNNNYESILDYVVYETRKYLLKINHSNDELSKLNLVNYCIFSNSKVLGLLDCLGLKNSFSITLPPGFVEMPSLFDGSGYHCITVVNIGNRYFLIDCTYAQYFTLRQNSLERLGLVNFMNCKLGTFMSMNKERLKVSNEILKRGWIELDEKVLKTYMDGFAFFYRNGLYYEKTQDYSYQINYTAQDYQNFLKKEDSQLNHESIKTLGYQKVPNIK